MRAAIYARVSSARQRDAHTIASQLSTLPAFCRTRGWSVVDTFVDDGKSAKEGADLIAERAGLRALHEAARRGAIDVVVVVDVDRFTRSKFVDERGAIYGPLQRAGVKIAVASTGSVIEWDTDEGELLLGIGNMQSSGWLRKHRERIQRGKLEAIRRGGKPAGPTPYGYSYDRATKTWSIDEAAAAIVREVFARVASGETCEAIAADFHARGIVRPRGGAWTLEAVYNLTRRRYYADGRWIADKAAELAVTVPAIVDADLWRQADEALEARGRRGLKRERTAALLQGLLVCGKCGAPIGVHYSGRPKSEGTPKVTYYICTRRRRGYRNRHAAEPCSLPMHRAAEVDALVWEQIEEIAERPDMLDDGVDAQCARRATAATAARDLRDAQQRLERHDAAAARILADFSRGAIAAEVYARHLDESKRRRELLACQVDAAQAAVEAHQRSTAQRQAAQDAVGALRERLRRADPAAQRALVLAMLPSAVLTDDGTVVGPMLLGAVAPLRSAGYSSVNWHNDDKALRLRLVTRKGSG